MEFLPIECTQSGDCRFLAYVPSWWKNQPWLMRVGVHAHPLSVYYHHVQSCHVRSSGEGKYTQPISSLPPYVLCGFTTELLLVQGGEEKLDRAGWEEPRGDTPAQVGSSGLPQGRQKPRKDPSAQAGSSGLPQGRQGPQHLGDTHPEWRRWASDNAILR